MSVLNHRTSRSLDLGRRQFLATSAAIAVTALAPSWAGIAVAGTPKKGGFFRVGIANGSTTDLLDPATTVSEFMIHLNFGLRNHLFELNSKNEAVRELTESYEHDHGFTRWTLRLRRGVEFHNGKTMVASDVVTSINYHRGEKSKSAVKSLLNDVQDITADGNRTIVFTLSRGNADFPYILADYHFVILPSDPGPGVGWRDQAARGCACCWRAACQFQGNRSAMRLEGDRQGGRARPQARRAERRR
jgi:peptide/nickel transport system substrate-binding protein